VFVRYTDGITEAEDAEGWDFGRERVLAVVRDGGERPAARLVAALHDAVGLFRGPAAAPYLL
jgi:serine phosphatase RsbU (regulator of sigma subunit)